MTKREIGMLLAYVAGACPQQKMNEMTPDAWLDILGHLDYDECRQAVRAVTARQPFVAPSEIIREIADSRSATAPHSNACRGSDHRNCLMSWCLCTCHPKSAVILTAPDAPKPRLALPAAPDADRDVREVLDIDAYRRDVAQADAAFMRKLAERSGGKQLRGVDDDT